MFTLFFDVELIGAVWPTNHSKIANAKKKTIALTSMVSLSFIVLWGPYYAIGIYTWFYPKLARNIPREVSILMCNMHLIDVCKCNRALTG